jgi:crotonobetainyl-CoA:carnitine CoA-transferase CaiB-like acyl-CoA transferase
MPGPLDGVRIIDFSAIVSGPLSTMMLADQGAEVIKVESPGFGDLMRVGAFRRGGLSAFYANANRGKRAITLDVQKPRGRELFLKLVEGADVLVQNFRPGAVERLGIGEPDCRKVNPDLIYVSISGFGDSGPYSDRRVYDPIIQGLTGHSAVQRNPEAPIQDLVRNIVCDKSTSYPSAQAISAALFARERGAGGQHIKIAMLDAALAFFWCDGMMAHTMIGEGEIEAPGPTLYDVYRLTETADGHLKWKTEEIMERLIAADVPAGPVLSLEELVDDPQIVHNKIIFEREHPTAGRMRQAGPAAHFSRTPAEPGRLPPLYGEHTDEVLAEIGIDEAERKALRDDGILG